MSAIAVISIFICLVGLQISAQDLQTAESRGEVYAQEDGHQTVGSSYGGSSYGGIGGHGQSGYSNGVYGKGKSYADPQVGISLPALAVGYVLARKLGRKISGKSKGENRSSSEKVGSAAENVGLAAEDVGSPNLNDYQSYQAPVIPAPLYTYSYPSPAAQVKCGKTLLISCSPTYQIAPCSSYSSHGVSSYGVSSYGSPSYGSASYGSPSYESPSYESPSYGYPSYGSY